MITRLAAPTAATIAVALTAVGLASAASLRVTEEPVLEGILVVFPDCDAATATGPGTIVVPELGCADGETPGTALGLSDGPSGLGAPIDIPAPSPTPSVPAPGQAPSEPGPTPPSPAPSSPDPSSPAPTAPAEPTPTEPAPTTPAPAEPSTAPAVEEDAGV